MIDTMQETSSLAPASDVLLAPPRHLMAVELPRAAWGMVEYGLRRYRLTRDRFGDDRPVLILPGLINTDRSNVFLRRYLRSVGYRPYGWALGRNLGQRTIGPDGNRLIDRIATIAADTGQPVTLIGISLGGIMARFIAHRRADLVREVITVSSPFAGPAHATNVWRAFELVSGERIESANVRRLAAECAVPLPVPTTAIWSRSDGLVNGYACRAPEHQGMRDIEVRSSHVGVQWRAQVLEAIGGVLAGNNAPLPGDSGTC